MYKSRAIFWAGRSMVKNMMVASDFHSDKKLVTHSTRKHLVQKLVDNNIPPNEMVQITGHNNINSLNNYSTISDKRQQHISAILSSGNGEPCGSAMISPSQKIKVDEITASSTVQPSTSAAALPFFYQCQVGTVNVFTNSDRKCGELEQKQVKKRRIIISDSDESQ